jgi:hypothetical protein
VARVVYVVDDLFGLPVTSGTVGVLEARQCAPGDALCRPHHPLESPAIAGGAFAVPGVDKAQQDTLNCASVEVSEGLWDQAKCLQHPEVEEALLRLLHHITAPGPLPPPSLKILRDFLERKKSHFVCHS